MRKIKKRRSKVWIIGLIITLLFLVTVIVIQLGFTIKTVVVEGNVHYTEEEIKDMIINDRLTNNSIYLSLKYRDKGITDIPFIETMDVQVLSNDTVKIKVYEKALAGYIQYLDRYLYFDKDGIIVESSNTAVDNVPLVDGLDFGFIALYQKLPVENDEIFGQILKITQLLVKYDVHIDKIYFDSRYHMTLYYNDIKVLLGTEEFLEQKIIRLTELSTDLVGKSGILYLENYNDDEEKSITFKEK